MTGEIMKLDLIAYSPWIYRRFLGGRRHNPHAFLRRGRKLFADRGQLSG
jgi:hypothetical protein